MQNEHKVFSRTYHNYSNINFDQIQQQRPPQSQNYRSMSQIGQMMTDAVDQPSQSRSVYHYNNKIAQVQKDYPILSANDPCFEKTNTNYQQFYSKAKKFPKPYTDCTKFSDNLMKNKQLLRRGQFDLPVEPILTNSMGIKNNKTNFLYTTTKTQTSEFQNTKNLFKLHSETMQNLRKRKPSNDQKNGFDKTLKQHANTYTTLLNQQRKDQKDKIKLQNSMNRILASEMISYRLLGTKNYFKSQTVRAQNRHS